MFTFCVIYKARFATRVYLVRSEEEPDLARLIEMIKEREGLEFRKDRETLEVVEINPDVVIEL